jgi:hypothetical protein
MIVEMFDKCSELDQYYKANYTYRNMNASEATLSSCDKLRELSNEHDNTLKMINSATAESTTTTATTTNSKADMRQELMNMMYGGANVNSINHQLIFKNIPGLPIYLLIILAIITVIFIAIPLVPVVITGSIIFVIFTIIFTILIMIGVYFTF